MTEQDNALTKVESLVEDFMIHYFASIYKVRYNPRSVRVRFTERT